mmetsp:Transcript_66148/g.187863  ORF Transcript_66148/g.187863 Transcript_66148/m.187863 type:complete len:240 (-) Transcript_66148:1398-2117(-)
MPRMKLMSITLLTVRLMSTVALMSRMRRSTSARCASSARSHLLSKIRSAKAICSTASFSTPSGFSSSRCSMTCLASTRVRIPSSAMCCCTKSSAKKVCATGAGSASPVVSMRMASSLRPLVVVLRTRFRRPLIRSPRTVQQMHPLLISTMSSSWAMLSPLTSASSMPTSPNSFSMTAMRLPWFSRRMWFSRVVLPLPRKPVMMLHDTFPSASGAGACCCSPARFAFSSESSGARRSPRA